MNDPLGQSAIITAQLGAGAVTLRECSNRSAIEPIPVVTLMTPEETEVINCGHSDAIVAHHSASSFRLGALTARQLYEFLHAYYARSGKNL